MSSPRQPSPRQSSPIRLGLRANAGQFALLVGINGLVGGMVGQERTLLPILGRDAFGLTGASVALTFLIAFGVTKAATNLVAGQLADRYGRKPVLVAGWLLALPVPLLIIWAPILGLDRRRQRPARREPGVDLVHDGADEDRPRRFREARTRPRAERGGGVRGRGADGARDGIHRGIEWPSAGPVLPGDRVRRPGARGLRAARPRDARACSGRTAGSRRRRSEAAMDGRLPAHDVRAPIVVRGVAGGSRQQPERRPRLGTSCRCSTRRPAWPCPRSRSCPPRIRPSGGWARW
ncbi:MAG: hypothetical protein WKF78_05850 [Candidatus Limnocylindrales bacterium]